MHRQEKTREVGGAKWDKEGRGREGQRRGARNKKTVEPLSLQKKNKTEHKPKPMSPSPYVLSQLLCNVIVVLDRVEALEGGTATG